ncbi:MAG: hypothetical protein FWH35_00015 [Treponema sp.]|nr:hypothetical protein [Treponema sp.]
MEMVNLDSDEAWEAWGNSMFDQIVDYVMEYDKKQDKTVAVSFNKNIKLGEKDQ